MKALFAIDLKNLSEPKIYNLHRYFSEIQKNRQVNFLLENVIALQLDNQSDLLGELIHQAVALKAQYYVVYLPDEALIFDYYKSQEDRYSVEFPQMFG